MSVNYSSIIVLLLTSSFALADSVSGSKGPIEITTLLHAGVQLEYQGTVVQVDPWDRLGLPGAKPADLILISDDPGHHLDVGAIERLRKPGASVVLTAAGKQKWPDGIVIANGETVRVAGVTVESIAAYDIIQGNPSHPKGDANGYVVSLGGKKFFFAGVTECVDEVKALQGIDVAFMPMNIPLARMTPAAAALNRLLFEHVPEHVLEATRRKVDSALAKVSPMALERFAVSYEELRGTSAENCTNACLGVRRVLLAFADSVFPAQDELVDVREVGEEQYVNRLWAHAKNKIESEKRRNMVQADLTDLGNRIDAISD